jgi:prepilin-type N-terminal cleavage/methylation domain-containing protein
MDMKGNGFSLIEVLVTLGVLAFGSVSVTVLQASLMRQGADNRTRIEAQALAQARLDELRAHAAALPAREAFDTALPATTGFAEATTVNGTNASFTRSEHIVDTQGLKTVTVRVEWFDAAGTAQQLRLATQLGFIAPQRIGAVARRIDPPSLHPPAGVALQGTGEAPDGVLLATHDDGTLLYRDSSNSLALVAGGRVVLRLPDACTNAGAHCNGFARIDGRVWIDRTTQAALAPRDVAVLASGASWCLRYYIHDGSAQPVTAQTLATYTTAGGDYMWFDYSCYVGSGWYGNVGITLTRGFTATGQVCIGDPLATELERIPVVAPRRAYRGLLHRRDGSTASGKEEVASTQGMQVRYYSHGIAAGTVLPDAGAALHDFVIGAFDTEQDNASCVAQGIMTRPDARRDGVDGALFAGMPAAFFCLNTHLDDYDAAQFGHEAQCAVDAVAMDPD